MKAPTEQDMDQINALSDKVLALVMNTEMENPHIAVAALSHVTGVIAYEMKMPENVFLICMINAYQALLEAAKVKEVH
jgi:hypothetical protein